jgi:hypothetical protein
MTTLLALLLLTQVAQGGVISGRILAEDGSPVVNKRIAAQAVLDRGDVDLGASLLAGISQTGDDGRFRLENIPPGRYYIVLDPLDLPSYYPGVTKPERASIVSVGEGAFIANLDFKMPDFDGGRVFGRLAPPAIPPAGPVRVTMYPGDLTGVSPTIVSSVTSVAALTFTFSLGGIIVRTGSSGSTTSAPVLADGTFEMPKVRKGVYTISTVPNVGIKSALVVIDDKDIHDLQLPPTGSTPETGTGAVVRGRVVENPDDILRSQLSVVLTGTVDRFYSKVSLNADGTFAIPNVPAGTYIAMTVPSPSASRHTVVEVADRNIDGVEVVPPYLVDVPGHVEIQGGQQLKAASPAMTIDAYHVDINGFRTVIAADGTFGLKLLAGDNRISLRNLPTDYRLVSLTYGNTDLLRQPLVPDLGNTDGIRILLAPAPPDSLHRVQGQVIGLPEVAIGPATRIQLTGANPGQHVAETPVNKDGTFEFSAVPSDFYSARVTGAPFESELRFDVRSADVEGVQVKGALRSEISGRVTIVDRNGIILPSFPFSYMTVEFIPSTSPSLALVHTDGTFAAGLAGGEYSLGVRRLPDGYSLKSATAGGADILKGRLKIDGKPVPEIVVTLETTTKTTP